MSGGYAHTIVHTNHIEELPNFYTCVRSAVSSSYNKNASTLMDTVWLPSLCHVPRKKGSKTVSYRNYQIWTILPKKGKTVAPKKATPRQTFLPKATWTLCLQLAKDITWRERWGPTVTRKLNIKTPRPKSIVVDIRQKTKTMI